MHDDSLGDLVIGVHDNNSVSEKQSVLPPNSEDSNEITFSRMFPSHRKIHWAKEALNAGREHITPKGKDRQARSLRLPCPENCQRCATPKFTEGERSLINKKFWDLKNHLKQWEYIKNSVFVSAVVYKVAFPRSSSRKSTSRKYFFKIDGIDRRVCKTMYRNTLSICDSWIDSAILHCTESGVQGDQRGKHRNRPHRNSRN